MIPFNVFRKFLFNTGNTDSIRSMRDIFDVGKSFYHWSIKRVASAVVDDILPRTIQWPTGNKIKETNDAFSDISGLLNILGAVDESHIPIKAPAKNRNAYYIHKKYHSVVLLASCDASLRFTFAWTGNSGSTNAWCYSRTS